MSGDDKSAGRVISRVSKGFCGKWKTAGVLAVICVIQLFIFLYFGAQKSYLMNDELFTYGTSNHREGITMEFPLNEWQNQDLFIEYATPGEDAFCYSIPYYNQTLDVHPPLYYYLIHTISSFRPHEFSYWTGVGLNLVLLLGCTIVLYFLTLELFGKRGCALLVCALFGLTYGALNTMLFVRMYMQFALFLLLHLLVYAKYWEKERIEKKGYLFLGLTLIGGALTQYYFLLAAFFLGIWYTLKLLVQKRFRETAAYFVTILISAGISLSLFPTMWNHIFHGTRGTQAQKAFLSFSGYGRSLLNMFNIISRQMFGGHLWLVLALIVLLLFVDSIVCRRIPLRPFLKVMPVIFMCAGYFLVVTKIAPYITDRYMMPIYPVVFVLAGGFIYWLQEDLLKKEGVAAGVCTVFLLLGILPVLRGDIPRYAFRNEQKHKELIQQYSDKKAVYIDREFYWWEYYNIVQMLKEHEEFYVISYARIVQWEIDAALEELAGDEEVIVYVGNSELDEEITEYIGHTLGAGDLVLLDEYDRWKIYRGVR